jgi:hypothetical protein
MYGTTVPRFGAFGRRITAGDASASLRYPARCIGAPAISSYLLSM